MGMQASSDTSQPEKFQADGLQSAGDAKNSLERLTQNLNQLQQQAQRMSNNQMMAQEGRKTLLVGKSVRPMKFEYEFQANPLFREKSRISRDRIPSEEPSFSSNICRK